MKKAGLIKLYILVLSFISLSGMEEEPDAEKAKSALTRVARDLPKDMQEKILSSSSVKLYNILHKKPVPSVLLYADSMESYATMAQKQDEETQKFPLITSHRRLLAQPLKTIGKLTDTMYLGLRMDGRLKLVTLHEGSKVKGHVKRVWYRIGKGRSAATILQKAHKKGNSNALFSLQEDLFIHLAVDNCMDKFGDGMTEKRDATAFVAVNHEGGIFYCSLKKPFYKHNVITLRQINNIAHLDGRNIKKLWLNANTIGMVYQEYK